MFRIKTDIRQYRCKSRDKVERLIRNWVIRPTDLIYDGDADDWRPIGEDPSFVELFNTLDEAHENQPETVVTGRAASKAAQDREDDDTDDGEKSDSNSTDARGSSVVLRQSSDADPQPPVPSDDVEGVIRDSDEITMMTERTLEMLTDDVSVPDDSEPQPKDPPTPPDDITPPETAGPDEKTELIEYPEDDGAVEKSAQDRDQSDDVDEDIDVVEQPTGEDEPADDEDTGVVEQPTGEDEPADDEDTGVVEQPTDEDEPADGEDTGVVEQPTDEDGSSDGEDTDIVERPDDEDEASKETTQVVGRPAPDGGVEEPQLASRDEDTDVVERPDDEDEASDDEDTDVVERPTDEDEASDDEDTDVVERPTDEDTDSEDKAASEDGAPSTADYPPPPVGTDSVGEAPRSAASAPDTADDVQSGDQSEISAPSLGSKDTDSAGPSVSGQRLRRHDLPEEVFVTAEIEDDGDDDTDDDDAARLDELSQLDQADSPPPDDDESVMESDREGGSQWNIILDDMPPEDDAAATDEESEDRAAAGPPPEADAGADDQQPDVDPLRDTDELEAAERDSVDEPRQPDSAATETPASEAPAREDDEQLDEELDEAFDGLEESAVAARQAQEAADDEELTEVSIIEALPDRDPDAVSAGYEVDFPIPITPSQRLLDMGIQRSYVSTRKRDRRYSRPQPKTPGELITQSYDLDSDAGFRVPGLAIIVATVVVIVAVFALALVLIVL